jgi:serralysin
MPKGLNQFLIDLRAHESSTNHTVVNNFGYMGWYQFGEQALADIGWIVDRGEGSPGYVYSNDYENYSWTTKSGIDSADVFLQSPDVQNRCMMDWILRLWQNIRNLDNGEPGDINGREFYAEQVLNGHRLTISGMVEAAHGPGLGRLLSFIDSGGITDLSDGNGYSISEALDEFAD